VAKYNIFNVVDVGRCKYLSLTVNPIVANRSTGRQNYVIDTKEYLFTSSILLHS